MSNLGDIRISCRVPPRPFPTEPGESRNGLRAATAVYEILANGSKKVVPSNAKAVGGGGGGFGPNPSAEWVEFDVHIPLTPEELDAETHRYLAKLEESMTPEQKEQFTEQAQKTALERVRESVYQNRVGHFQMVCHILDGSHVVGSDVVEIEVVFVGRFSDDGLAQWPTAISNRQPFSITIKAPSEEVVAGAQIVLEIKILNTSDEIMVARSAFQAYGGDPTYEYSCHDSEGKLVSKEILMIGSAHDPPLLNPGETYESTVLLDRVCDLSRPGRYDVQLYRGVPMGRPEYAIKSNKIEITVVPWAADLQRK